MVDDDDDDEGCSGGGGGGGDFGYTLMDGLVTMLKVKNIFIFQNSNDLCLFLLFL